MDYLLLQKQNLKGEIYTNLLRLFYVMSRYVNLLVVIIYHIRVMKDYMLLVRNKEITVWPHKFIV